MNYEEPLSRTTLTTLGIQLSLRPHYHDQNRLESHKIW